MSNTGTYQVAPSLQDVFQAYSVGIVTGRDKLTLAFSSDELHQRLDTFLAMAPEEARQHFALGEDTREWQVARAQQDLRDSSAHMELIRVLYRPFDTRFTFRTGTPQGFHCQPGNEAMHFMQVDDTVGLLVGRRAPAAHGLLNAVFVGDLPVDFLYHRPPGTLMFPLYLAENEPRLFNRKENFHPEFRDRLNERYGQEYVPEDILSCIYAILHSPDYQRRYHDLLHQDLPRIPFPQSSSEFTRLAQIGQCLIGMHLLREPSGRRPEIRGDGDDLVQQARFREQRLYFNPTQYLAPVSRETWEFRIGGRRPLEQYLQARKGRILTRKEAETLRAAAGALTAGLDLIPQIDP